MSDINFTKNAQNVDNLHTVENPQPQEHADESAMAQPSTTMSEPITAHDTAAISETEVVPLEAELPEGRAQKREREEDLADAEHDTYSTLQPIGSDGSDSSSYGFDEEHDSFESEEDDNEGESDDESREESSSFQQGEHSTGSAYEEHGRPMSNSVDRHSEEAAFEQNQANNTKPNDTVLPFSVIEGTGGIGSLHPSMVIAHVLSAERVRWLKGVGSSIVKRWELAKSMDAEEATSNNSVLETDSVATKRSNAEVIRQDGVEEILKRFDFAVNIAVQHSIDVTRQRDDIYTAIMRDQLRSSAVWTIASYPFPEVENIKQLPVSAAAAIVGSTNNNKAAVRNIGDHATAPLTRSVAAAKRQQWFEEADRWLANVSALLCDPLGHRFAYRLRVVERLVRLVRRGEKLPQRWRKPFSESPPGESHEDYWNRIFFMACRTNRLTNPFITGTLATYSYTELNKAYKTFPQATTDINGTRREAEKHRVMQYQQSLAQVAKRHRAEKKSKGKNQQNFQANPYAGHGNNKGVLPLPNPLPKFSKKQKERSRNWAQRGGHNQPQRFNGGSSQGFRGAGMTPKR